MPSEQLPLPFASAADVARVEDAELPDGECADCGKHWITLMIRLLWAETCIAPIVQLRAIVADSQSATMLLRKRARALVGATQ